MSTFSTLRLEFATHIAPARMTFKLGAARSHADGSDHVLEFTTVAGKTYDMTSPP
jgi:hypothetical protein